MKIVHIVPGSGGTFYCQNCLRDEALIVTLRDLGHDVILVPMYLPTFKEGSGLKPDAPVFYGAINTYLKEKMPFLSKYPKWLEKLLNASRLLNWAGSKAGSTRAEGLEGMTLSVLQGEDGNQGEELERMVAWLKHETAPDIVHISNALLLGIAEPIKKALGVPIFCTLQDEDTWVDQMEPRFAEKIWSTMAEKALLVDGFVAVSDHFMAKMKEKLNLPEGKLHRIYVGTPLVKETASSLPMNPAVIGFLSPMCESLGLGELIDAFISLKSQEKQASIKLKAFGGLTNDNKDFLARQIRKLKALGFEKDVEFLTDYNPAEKVPFLQSLSMLSVPNRKGEALGVFIIEAMALGVPVIQPRVGGYTELINLTGAGILYNPTEENALTSSLECLLDHPDNLHELGRKARKAAEERFSIETMAREMIKAYETIEKQGTK